MRWGSSSTSSAAARRGDGRAALWARARAAEETARARMRRAVQLRESTAVLVDAGRTLAASRGRRAEVQAAQLASGELQLAAIERRLEQAGRAEREALQARRDTVAASLAALRARASGRPDNTIDRSLVDRRRGVRSHSLTERRSSMSEGMLAHAKELTAMRSEVLARDDVPAASYLGVLFDLYGMGAVVGAPSCWPTQAEFAERTGRSQSGVSKLLGRLVEEGAVERRRDRHRRRRARRPVPATHRSATGQQGRRSPPVSEKDGM